MSSNTFSRAALAVGVLLSSAASRSAVAQNLLPDSAQSQGGAPSLAVEDTGGEASFGYFATTSVQPSTGTFHATLPITLPRARGVPQIDLHLGFSSAGGSGIAGWGWDLDLPRIERRGLGNGPPNYEDPTGNVPLDPQLEDQFFFKGQPLVPLCRTDQCATVLTDGEQVPTGLVGWYYFRLAFDTTFDRFFWSPSHATWLIISKSGVVTQLGAPLDNTEDHSAIDVDVSSGIRSVPADAYFRWNISRQYDRYTWPSGNPANLTIYQWGQLTSTNGAIPVTDIRGYLTDVFDTPPSDGAAVASFAHHVHITYNQPNGVHIYTAPLWLGVPSWTIYHIDVTSQGTGTTREQLRRYWLDYLMDLQGWHLSEFSLEGRCVSTANPVEANSELPPTPACPLWPATTFTYQAERPIPTNIAPVLIAGTIPPNSAVYDINSDGLPDFVEPPTGPYIPQVVALNSTKRPHTFTPSTIAPAPGDPIGYPVPAVYSNLGNTPPFWTPQALRGNFRNDGFLNAIAAYGGGYSSQGLYTVSLYASGGPQWTHSAFANEVPLSPFVADIDGNGLTDVIDPGAMWGRVAIDYSTKDATGLTYPLAPINDDICVGGDLTAAILFAQNQNAAPILVDMNVDGIPDIAVIQSTSVTVYPGHGDGSFGICRNGAAQCPCSEQGPIVVPINSPIDAGSVQAAQLGDVTGDGVPELLWFNSTDLFVESGYAGLDAAASTPFASAVGYTRSQLGFNAQTNLAGQTIFIADMNGNGVPDVVIQSEFNRVQYIDLHGEEDPPPGYLLSLENGLEGFTLVTFESTTKLASPGTWALPQPVYVCTGVVNEALEPAGAWAQPVLSTTYAYGSPVYSSRDASFVGFQSVTETHNGDDGSSPSTQPGTVFHRTFDYADCEISSLSSPCPLGTDRPELAVRALPVVVEDSNVGSSVYRSSTHTGFTVQVLATGLDGRNVRMVWPSQTDTYLFDTAFFSPGPVGITNLQDVTGPDALDGTVGFYYQLPATPGAHLRRTETRDAYGNTTLLEDCGNVVTSGTGADSYPDGTIEKHTHWPMPSDEMFWLWRPDHTWTDSTNSDGGPSAPRNEHLMSYDAFGGLTDVYSMLSGGQSLARANPSGNGFSTGPSTISTAAEIHPGHYSRDTFGNVTLVQRPNGQCEKVGYDSAFNEWPQHTSAGINGCGQYATLLTSNESVDAVTGLVTATIDPNGITTQFAYDPFGRLSRVDKPDPTIPLEVVTGAITIDRQFGTFGTTAPPTWPMSAHRVEADGNTGLETWTYWDSFARPVMNVQKADTAASDAAPYVAFGFPIYGAAGRISGQHLKWFTTTNSDIPTLMAQAAAQPATSLVYDAFGRVLQTSRSDGTPDSAFAYHALSVDLYDANGLTAGTHPPKTQTMDGHGRPHALTEVVTSNGVTDTITTTTSYLPTGEVASISKTHTGNANDSVVHTLGYDSLGRMVMNSEPNASTATSGWRYAYDDSGRLVGTSDARGCGVDYYYDNLDHKIAEDYSPCVASQGPYVAYDPTTTSGSDAYYQYLEPSHVTILHTPPFAFGRMISKSDRASTTSYSYDGRGRVVTVARQIALPGVPAPARSARYAPGVYTKALQYDPADRVVTEGTGLTSDVSALSPPSGATSSASLTYSARGVPSTLTSPYGAMINRITYDQDGRNLSATYGDAAGTVRTSTYDVATGWPETTVVSRHAPALWKAASGSYTPPTESGTGQLVLIDHGFLYDGVGNPLLVTDLRTASEWPPGASPVSVTPSYDTAYRLTGVSYAVNDVQGPVGSADAITQLWPTPALRMTSQTYKYDWLGNVQASSDNSSAFPVRSLGTAQIGGTGFGPNQIAGSVGPGTGQSASVAYDAAGNVTSVTITAPCATETCTATVGYQWDEAGRLAEAQQTTLVASKDNAALGTGPVVTFAYDSAGERVLRTTTPAAGPPTYTAEIFPTLRLNQTEFLNGDYERTATTEAVYLGVGGSEVARLVYSVDDPITSASGTLHVFYEISDLRASNTAVVDQETGELVEYVTYSAYGAPESDYRPARWGTFHEDYGFSQKEEDDSLGLTYFGARYYSTLLSRWLSADPLAVHGLRGTNPYAYVNGNVYASVDPLGLAAESTSGDEETFEDEEPVTVPADPNTFNTSAATVGAETPLGNVCTYPNSQYYGQDIPDD